MRKRGQRRLLTLRRRWSVALKNMAALISVRRAHARSGDSCMSTVSGSPTRHLTNPSRIMVYRKLTVPMVARLQGFPDTWRFTGRKTLAYRQVGNASPAARRTRSWTCHHPRLSTGNSESRRRAAGFSVQALRGTSTVGISRHSRNLFLVTLVTAARCFLANS